VVESRDSSVRITIDAIATPIASTANVIPTMRHL
jgi:hypothetical protein